MPRQRKAPETSSEESGKFGPIPDNYAEYIGNMAENPAYQRAWAYARSRGNVDKACLVYAENHWQEYEDAPSAEKLQEEIDRLTKLKEGMESAS